MSKCNTDYEYKQLSTKDIFVKENAQRDVRARDRQFRRIMREFNPHLVNPLKVALIDGKYWCIDGQMTMKVLKAKNNGRDLLVDCKVFYGLTDLDAAELFVKQNGTTSSVSVLDKLRVQYNYGEKDVVDFVRLTEMNGVSIDWCNSKGKNKVVAVSTLFRIFTDFNDPREYSTFLHVILDAWDGVSESFRKEILGGLHLFMKTYRGEYKVDLLTKRLRNTSPVVIIRNAQVSTSSGDRKYAVQIFNAYNSGTSKNRLLERL